MLTMVEFIGDGFDVRCILGTDWEIAIGNSRVCSFVASVLGVTESMESQSI